MPTAEKNKAALEGMIAKANAATGGTDTTLTAAMNTLIAGFGSGGGSGGVSLENVSVLVADFAETESLTVLSGTYYGTKQAIVS